MITAYRILAQRREGVFMILKFQARNLSVDCAAFLVAYGSALEEMTIQCLVGPFGMARWWEWRTSEQKGENGAKGRKTAYHGTNISLLIFSLLRMCAYL